MPCQLLLTLIIGVAQGLGCAALGLPFALLLSVFAGLAEAIPMVGPYLGAIPAILIALSLSPQLALLLAGYTMVLYLVESNVLVPWIEEVIAGAPLDGDDSLTKPISRERSAAVTEGHQEARYGRIGEALLRREASRTGAELILGSQEGVRAVSGRRRSRARR